MLGRRLLSNKHKTNNEFIPPKTVNYSHSFINQKQGEEIKFNEEKESEINLTNSRSYYNEFHKEKEKENEKGSNKDNIMLDYENKQPKKKSVIVNKGSNFFGFSSGITLNENDEERRGIYDLNSSSGNFLRDTFSTQNYYEQGKKKDNETDHIFAPLTQEDMKKINTEKNNSKNNYNNNKFRPKKIDLKEFNEMNQQIINDYNNKKNSKIKNNDEIELNLEEEDPYCDDESSGGGMPKMSKKQYKLMDKLGIDLEDENLDTDLNNIIKDKVDRIKEVKDHQRKCLLVENLDGLYGRSQNPDDIVRGIYSTLNDENDDSEYEEEIDKWEKAQFKSGIKLNQLNLNEDFYNKNNNNEINLNFKCNNLYEKLNKKEGIDLDDLIDNISLIVDRDKSLLYNFVNKKNDYNIELSKIINNKNKLEKDLDNYIKQYCVLKNILINKILDKKDEPNEKKETLDKFYVSD